MSLEIIIGKNKTGKTKYLEEKYRNTKNSNILFIQTETDFNKVLKGNEGGSGRNEIPSPHKKVINFLNEIVGNSFKVKVYNDDEFSKFVKFKNIIDDFNKILKDIDDAFFENCFRNSFETTNLNEVFDYKFELIKYNNELDKIGSSGSLYYSLIKILYEMILYEKITFNEKFILVIDEIEKFLHPELLFKIAHMILKVSEKIDVILTTHSPIFLERMFYLHKRIIKDGNECDIKYSLKYKYDEKNNIDNIFTFNNKIISNILNEKNYRTISNLSFFLFSSKCFLVEGLIDNTIINDIISNLELNIPYTIIDCDGRNNVEALFKMIRELSIIPFYDLCLFYDSDSESGENKDGHVITIKEEEKEYVSSIINHPDIEQSLFNVKKENKDKPHKVTSIITKNGDISTSSFKSEKNFVFGIEWILKNSTKPKNEIKEKINTLIEQIKYFLTKN